MKILKIVAKIIGLIWMILFGIAMLFIITKQSFDFSNSYGLGYFMGMVLSMVVIFSIGYFLFRWGKKPLPATL